jgi:microcystin synthetase protein McyJ
MPTAERALLHRGGRRGTWGNLGLWPGGEADYAEACTALAHAVARAAGLGAGDVVLDLACGAGDELLLWLDHYGAARVHAIELDPLLARAASQRVGERAAVVCGSALLRPAQALFDRVVCVDAAYHLQPRSAFLQAAWHALKPGGTLAYTDLTLRPGARQSAWLRAAARLAGVAPQELLGPAAQVQRLLDHGFVDVAMQPLDDAVLGGFARFVRAQGPRVARTLLHRDWRRVGLTAALIGPCRRAGLGYGLFAARKNPAAEIERATS